MAINWTNAAGLAKNYAISALEDALYSVNSDSALQTCGPAEAEIRNKLSFSNIRIQFPTVAGKLPYVNFLSTNALTFPAYVTTFSDKFTPQVSGQQAYCRTDPSPVFKGVNRSITLGLTIPCMDVADADQNMKKINQFIKNLYPAYNSFKGDLVIGSPPLIRVKFANLITNQVSGYSGLLGYVTSFDYSFDVNDGFYFSSNQQFGDSNNLFFRAYKLTFTFSVLHEGTVGSIDGNFNFKNDFPYQTNTNSLLGAFGDTKNTAANTPPPISQQYAEENMGMS